MRPAVFDRFAMPACAELLGWDMLDFDTAKGWVKIGFETGPQFRNGSGFVQGGFVAAMLDDTMGPAVLVASEGRFYVVTIGLHLTFIVSGLLFAMMDWVASRIGEKGGPAIPHD